MGDDQRVLCVKLVFAVKGGLVQGRYSGFGFVDNQLTMEGKARDWVVGHLTYSV
ncbi:MAG: hypothetical protein RIR95_4 [Pseudomonadota bacterium]